MVIIVGESAVHSNPEIMSGTPIFVGTRVSVDILFDYLIGGHNLAEFFEVYPTVRRDQAVAALEVGRESVLDSAQARPPR